MDVMYPTDETGPAEANESWRKRSLFISKDLSDRGMLVRIYFHMKAGRVSGSQQHYWQMTMKMRAAAMRWVERQKGCAGVS